MRFSADFKVFGLKIVPGWDGFLRVRAYFGKDDGENADQVFLMIYVTSGSNNW